MGQPDHLWVQLGLSLVLTVALIALPVAILIALALIRLFRRRVAMSMRATAGVPQHPESVAGGGSEGVLDIEVIEMKSVEERVPPLLGDAQRRSRELAAIHAEAACVYPWCLACCGGHLPIAPFSMRPRFSGSSFWFMEPPPSSPA